MSWFLIWFTTMNVWKAFGLLARPYLGPVFWFSGPPASGPGKA